MLRKPALWLIKTLFSFCIYALVYNIDVYRWLPELIWRCWCTYTVAYRDHLIEVTGWKLTACGVVILALQKQISIKNRGYCQSNPLIFRVKLNYEELTNEWRGSGVSDLLCLEGPDLVSLFKQTERLGKVGRKVRKFSFWSIYKEVFLLGLW